ncbi:MAG: ATP-binding protein, partial [Natronosporangium sp.]
TALAVHWAHQVADQFPDGQLYANLRGFHPSGRIMEPAEAVRGFLDALGVPPQRIPAGLAAQAGLYRSTLAGRRVLVVLDNARDADQVRPLLPGSPTCLVVVTSRNQLTGLVATETAQPLLLDLLEPDEARELLAGRLGPDRVATEPDAVAEIIDRCTRLPLALAVTAARAAAYPGFPLRVLAAQLREAQAGLDGFAADDPATDARAVFSWSYQILSAEAATLFRQLGRHAGPDISVPAAASLGALPLPGARRLLAELARAQLVTEHTPGRYTFHDLLRAYAAELSDHEDADHDRQAALHRLLDHYLHTAAAAAPLITSRLVSVTLPQLHPGVAPERLVGQEQATTWFASEHTVLLAAIDRASLAGLDTHAWQLAWAVAGYFYRRWLWHDLAATARTALVAARRLGDLVGQARAHANLGGAYTYLDRQPDGQAHLQHALHLNRQLGDSAGQARVHLFLAVGYESQDRYADAFCHAQQALDLYLAADERADLPRALNAVGWYHSLLGRHEQALHHCQRALAMQREHGDRHGQAGTVDSLGHIYHRLGQRRAAIASYQRALELSRADGNRHLEATTINHLGDVHLAAGEPDAARTTWREALAILDELGSWEAGKVRAKLQNLTSPA